MRRPMPPLLLVEPDAPDEFVPAPEIVEWALATFVAKDGRLHNPEHEHLEMATLGALWTNAPNSKHGRAIVGQAELGRPNAMGRWAKAKATLQVERWFGCVPDFLLTFDAGYALNATDLEFSHLIEHELCHLGQALDNDGEPRFSKDGAPMYAIKGHDSEEFVSMVRRYGAVSLGTAALIEAGTKAPEIGKLAVSQACGTCQLRVVGGS